MTVNITILATVIAFSINTHSGQAVKSATATLTSSSSAAEVAANPLDQVSSANIAELVATMTALPEATAVRNQADSVTAELAITPADSIVTAKPQIVATALKSRNDIQTYVSKAGDTVTSIAAQFGVNSNSIKWSNSLTSDSVSAGTKLVIPPINGIVYTVKAGDTLQSLAQKYGTSSDQINFYNDAELTGLHTGEQIIIPNGQLPSPTVYSTPFSFFGGTPTYGYNGYDFGYCTWWVATRRAQVGKPLPSNLGNASTWGYLARAYGLSTGSTPQTYAAVITSTIGQGHVAFVESVNSDGSINVSEMNVVGWDVVDHKTIPADQAARFTYIY